MAAKDVAVYVADMLDAIAQIASYVRGVTEADFFGDAEKQDAVFRRLMMIGEAAKHIPESVRVHHPDIPWREITGMRDKLIHDYSGIRADLVWRTIQDDLPKLEAQLRTMR